MTFYHLSQDENYKEVEYEQGTDWETIKCKINSGHQRAGKRLGQLRINIRSKKIADFLWTFLGEIIISDEVLKVFKENHITGFEVKPVEVCNVNVSQHYWELEIKGSGGEADLSSGIFLKKECSCCHLKRYSAFENGIIVKTENWDGSDIFTMTGYSGYVLISEKLKKIIENGNFKGLQMVPSETLRWPEGVVKP
jgi:hypothetical protein